MQKEEAEIPGVSCQICSLGKEEKEEQKDCQCLNEGEGTYNGASKFSLLS